MALDECWALVFVATVVELYFLSGLRLAILLAKGTNLMTGRFNTNHRVLLLLHKVWHRLNQLIQTELDIHFLEVVWELFCVNHDVILYNFVLLMRVVLDYLVSICVALCYQS